MSKVSYMTEDGLRKMREELEYLVNVERPSISQQIAEARDKGDLSENAEYEAAKEAQGMLEMKIAILQEKITSARIIDESKLDRSSVQILATVQLKNLTTGALMTYMIVSENEANLKEGKIAINTPIAKGIIGKKVGDKVEITVPSGKISLEILSITYS